MKKGLHPEYRKAAKVTCACGNEFTVGSTKPDIHVEICSACHPFFGGKKKLVDQAGRVERFEKIAEKSAKVKAQRAIQKAAPRRKKKLETLTEKQWKKLA